MPVMEIDTGALVRNAEYVKKISGVDLCAVVKADAYGHGLARTAKTLSPVADMFAVATTKEAIVLSAVVPGHKILVLGCAPDIGFDYAHTNIIPSVGDETRLNMLAGRADMVEIAVNTGMNRVGCKPCDTFKLYEAATKRGISVHGIYSHFYDDSDPNACKRQFAAFTAATEALRGKVEKLHICASNCLSLPANYRLDMVRAGLAIYGYGYGGLVPAARVYTEIVAAERVRKGDNIGYGTCLAPRNMRIATIRVGYGDGYRRIDGQQVSLNGKLCKVVGKICMDLTMIDVSAVDCAVGDRVFLLGEGVNMEKFCQNNSTISHEVLTMFNGRTERRYV